jgi:hypothetical protein
MMRRVLLAVAWLMVLGSIAFLAVFALRVGGL